MFEVDDVVTMKYRVMGVASRRGLGKKEVIVYLELLPLEADGLVQIHGQTITVRAELASPTEEKS